LSPLYPNLLTLVGVAGRSLPGQELTLVMWLFATGKRFRDLAGSLNEELRHWAECPVLQGDNADRPGVDMGTFMGNREHTTKCQAVQ
jgi:hypothetical protein